MKSKRISIGEDDMACVLDLRKKIRLHKESSDIDSKEKLNLISLNETPRLKTTTPIPMIRTVSDIKCPPSQIRAAQKSKEMNEELFTCSCLIKRNDKSFSEIELNSLSIQNVDNYDDQTSSYLSESHSSEPESDENLDEKSRAYPNASLLLHDNEKIKILPPKIIKTSFAKNYRKFGLSRNWNKDNETVSPSELTHAFLPLRMKNNENYKVNLIKFLRKDQHPHTKTDTCKAAQYRKFSQIYDGNVTKFFSTFEMKRRKVTSEKKYFESQHPFYDFTRSEDENGVPQYFNFYSDKEIGFTSKWQRPLRVAEMDDDVTTDDDLLYNAGKHVIKEIAEGMRSFVKNKKCVRNMALLTV